MNRQTDSLEKIKIRISKAKKELALSEEFDFTLVNDDLEIAKSKIEEIVNEFIFNK